MNETDEILDVFDDTERQIDTIRRGEISTLQSGGGRYIRAVNAFIQRPDGAIWVPTRSMHKSIAPGGLDYSTGGHLGQGEDYMDCLLRELVEEASLTCRESDLQLVHRTLPNDDNSAYFSRAYLVRTEKIPQLSSEHSSAEWMTVDELIERLEAGAPAKRSLLPDARALKEYIAA
mgnify:CR=1 FL=1